MQNNIPRVYLDFNATTPLLASLIERSGELFALAGNPSSIHHEGRAPKAWLRTTRQKIAELLGCSPLEIIFNSGGSEGNSSVLNSVWEDRGAVRPEIILSAVEHPSLMKAARALESKGAILHLIPVDRFGKLDLEFLQAHLSERTAFVSVMYANNETGTIFPIAQVATMAHAVGALMHSDCVQMLGKAQVSFGQLQLDYASFSAHKLYSLKGTGFLFARRGVPWTPLIFGGGQERFRRGGTENVMGIAGLGIIFEELRKTSFIDENILRMAQLRDGFESELMNRLPNVQVTAAQSPRLANTSSLIISGVDGETLLMSLDLKGFAVSTGAACSSGNPEPSPVLLAMGLSPAEAQSSLRVSLGWLTTEIQIKDFTDTLVHVVQKLRNLKTPAESPKQERTNRVVAGEFGI